MAEKEAQRAREAEAQQAPFYEWVYSEWNQRKVIAETGTVVIRGKEIPWEQGRQARVKWYMHPLKKDLSVQGWLLFHQDIRTHSGRHRHQGGLAIYVIEGKGWTTVDGVRYDWEEGDLILLPIKARGVEHQHFNAMPGSPCKWMALIYTPFIEAMSSELEQKEPSPDYSHV
ncbi:MAG: cupin domain-containing protein [Dehalococcoidia bacterium]|nr:cupin domain-containing protein [Dehalococcoidia bacterium]